MRPYLAPFALLVFSLAPLACDRTDSVAEGKRLPNPPPTGSAMAPSLSVAVVLDGVPAPALDAARFDGAKADFTEGERHAFRMVTLLGPAVARPGTSFAITGDQGLVLTMTTPADPKAPEPVLVVSRRGEVIATLLDPSQPFPPYHGWGGRLGRPGDPLPRIGGVTRIEVRSAEPGK
jgi:hypothetical protein